MENYYYVYVLSSFKDGKNGSGYSKNVELKCEQHLKGEVEPTTHRMPLELTSQSQVYPCD